LKHDFILVRKKKRCMKEYLETIERILGIPLTRKEIEALDIRDDMLITLKVFSKESYPDRKIALDASRPEITCFMPFQEIVKGNFRTYRGDGSLSGHWPLFDELANAVMYCDRVIIHDHLGAYASSALDGYTVGHRYDGLRNWLNALADWRELIIEQVICILPQHLSYHPTISQLSREDELSDLSGEIFYRLNPDLDPSEELEELQNLLTDIVSVENLITAASIPSATGRYFAPFYNDPDDLLFHQGVVGGVIHSAKLELLRNQEKASWQGARNIYDTIAIIDLPGLDLDYERSGMGSAQWRSQTDISAQVRKTLHKTFGLFAGNSAYLQHPSEAFKEQVSRARTEITGITRKYFKPLVSLNGKQRYFSFILAGARADGWGHGSLPAPMGATLKIMHNLPVPGMQPDSFCHYAIAFCP
jgi:hypothetical protein